MKSKLFIHLVTKCFPGKVHTQEEIRENMTDLRARFLACEMRDGEPVLVWPDISGNGNDLVSRDPETAPTFRAGVIFNGESFADFNGR